MLPSDGSKRTNFDPRNFFRPDVMRMWTFYFGLLILFQPILRAQQDEESPAVVAEILTLCDSGYIKDLYYTSKSKEPLKMSIYSRGFAPPITYKGAADVKFFRPAAGLEQGFDDEPNIVGSVRLPAGVDRILLLFEKDRESEGETYRIFALDNRLSRFPGGSYRFFNTSSITLHGVLGATKFGLKPGESKIVIPSGEDEHNNVELRFFHQEEESGKMEAIYTSVWNIKSNRRSSVFISASKSRVRKLSIRKIVEPLVVQAE